jgi:predicted ester cyclase
MVADLDVLRPAFEKWNAHDAEGYTSYYHPDVTLHGFPEGVGDRATLAAFYQSIWAGLPDARATLEDAFASEDRVAVRLTVAGTHDGELMGVTPTHRPVRFEVITILRFDDGRVAERWNVADLLGVLQQIGAVPAPA